MVSEHALFFSLVILLVFYFPFDITVFSGIIAFIIPFFCVLLLWQNIQNGIALDNFHFLVCLCFLFSLHSAKRIHVEVSLVTRLFGFILGNHGIAQEI